MSAQPDAIQLARLAARAAASKLGRDITAIDVSERLGIADVFLIVTAANEPQAGAIVEAVEEALDKNGRPPVRREGARGAAWMLLDCVDLVVHVMRPQERMLYSLERLWKDCPLIELGLRDQ